MTAGQQTPIFSDVARFFAYPVKQSPNNNVQINVAGGSAIGSVNFKQQFYFALFGIQVFTNYDNVGGPIVSTANSNAILPRCFAPNNFTVKLDRGNSNKYSNDPIPQAMLCSSGYFGGKVFPIPVVYGPRTNIQFTFQDLTNLYLQATVGGAAVTLTIQMFLCGYDIPITQWDKFCAIFPEFANIYAGGNNPLAYA